MAQSSSSAIKQQHHGINGVIKPIAADLIPPPGPITIVPGLYPVDYFISPIREANPEVEITDLSQDTVGLIWTDIGSKGAAEKLSEVLNTHSKIGWVQFPMAGIEKFEEVIKAHANIVWTSAKVSRGKLVGEMVPVADEIDIPRSCSLSRVPLANPSPSMPSLSSWRFSAISLEGYEQSNGRSNQVCPSSVARSPFSEQEVLPLPSCISSPPSTSKSPSCVDEPSLWQTSSSHPL